MGVLHSACTAYSISCLCREFLHSVQGAVLLLASALYACTCVRPYTELTVSLAGAPDGRVQHCHPGVEAQLLWYVWTCTKQCAHEWLLPQGKTGPFPETWWGSHFDPSLVVLIPVFLFHLNILQLIVGGACVVLGTFHEISSFRTLLYLKTVVCTWMWVFYVLQNTSVFIKSKLSFYICECVWGWGDTHGSKGICSPSPAHQPKSFHPHLTYD